MKLYCVKIYKIHCKKDDAFFQVGAMMSLICSSLLVIIFSFINLALKCISPICS